MNRIYTICLIVAIFWASAGAVYAAFNYDSARNYFLLDSILKTGGHYILIGDGLSGYCHEPGNINSRLPQYFSQSQCQANNKIWREILSKVALDGTETASTDFFAVSNNLIFLPEARFSSGIRQIAKNSTTGIYEFKTNALSIKGNNNLDISTIGAGKELIISPEVGKSLTVSMNQNLVVSAGLSFFNIDPDQYHIYVDKVITPQLGALGGGKVKVNNGRLILSSGSGLQAMADNIFFNSTATPLCKLKTINSGWYESYVHAPAQPNNEADLAKLTTMNTTTCDPGYFIYDTKIRNKGTGYMVCCKIDFDAAK
jgi:hypothetical protein